MQERKLFKFYLNEAKIKYEKTPDFFYRTNRWRMETNMRRPLGFAPWYTTNGWFFRGALLYLAYHYLIKDQPIRKNWNREGYEYETHHKTSRHAY